MSHLGLFAKFWQPGQVKTRLASRLGKHKASQLYYAFLSHLLVRLGDCGDVRTIAYAPPDQKHEFARLTQDGLWGLVSQQGDDLGERMQHFFEWAMGGATSGRSERTKVVLIGSDTPQLDPSHVEQAFRALEDSEHRVGSEFGWRILFDRDGESLLACF